MLNEILNIVKLVLYKRSPLGQRKSGLNYKTGDLLREV